MLLHVIAKQVTFNLLNRGFNSNKILQVPGATAFSKARSSQSQEVSATRPIQIIASVAPMYFRISDRDYSFASLAVKFSATSFCNSSSGSGTYCGQWVECQVDLSSATD